MNSRDFAYPKETTAGKVEKRKALCIAMLVDEGKYLNVI